MLELKIITFDTGFPTYLFYSFNFCIAIVFSILLPLTLTLYYNNLIVRQQGRYSTFIKISFLEAF